MSLMAFAPGSSLQAQNAKSLQVLHDRYLASSKDFQRDMEVVAKLCEAGSYFSDAEAVRVRAVPASEQTLNIDELPAQVLSPISPDLPDVERQWRVKLRKVETDYAAVLYKLSRDALNLGHVSFSFELIREVAFHDPDHKFARRLLGFKQVGDDWTTPFAATMEARGYEYHKKFGWLPKAHVDRYEKGERLYAGNWISIEREESIRSDFNHGWEIQTEHFHVKTNHSLEVGVQIGEELESFHKYFVREFAAFFNSPAQMKRLFDQGEAGTGIGKRFTVYYFRNKQDFVKHLIREQPNIAITNGLYLPNKRVACFFHNPGQEEANLETMYHEVTHQLLSESNSKTYDVGVKSHFWLVEGLPCYIESYRVEEDVVHIGDPLHPRFYWARERLVKDNEFYDFASFTSLGMQQFQHAGDVATLQKYYAQAASMTHFFLNYQDGVYRDALLTHLSDIYNPITNVRNRAKGMDDLTGVSYEVLHQQYREYLTALVPAEATEVTTSENAE
ncbi:MAG: hypothetical protein KDA66_12710 [Planctomycetaceae bacterium]|nr:hypothetical protein [Planctomycetaceae bacterium]